MAQQPIINQQVDILRGLKPSLLAIIQHWAEVGGLTGVTGVGSIDTQTAVKLGMAALEREVHSERSEDKNSPEVSMEIHLKRVGIPQTPDQYDHPVIVLNGKVHRPTPRY